jgi:phage terminase large subunit-like protein
MTSRLYQKTRASQTEPATRKGSGPMFGRDLSVSQAQKGKKVAETLEKKWRSLQIISVSPDADKVTRSGPLTSIIREGDFYVVSDE